MHICQNIGLHLDPQRFLDQCPIPVVEEIKFLGVIFDRRLSFIPHLKYVKKKGLKALNILKVIGNSEWGADRKFMLRLYRSLVRSKLDYGCIVYGSARKSYLQMLDHVHNQGIRLCLGAFRTSPVVSLYVDAHEPCLGARRAKVYLQYASNIKSLPKHPTHDTVFDNKYMKLFDSKPNANCTFGLHIKQFFTASNIEFSDILETTSYFVLPPWCIKPPKIVLDLVHLKKDCTDAYVYQQLFMEIRDRYRDHIPVYTDGSRDGNYVACAASDTIISMRLPDSASIFSAEIWAIIKALEQIRDSVASKYIIFTLTFVSPSFKVYGMVIRKCFFLIFIMPIKTLPFVGYPVMLALRAMKRQTLLPSLLWSCLVSRLVYLTLTLNTILTNILFPLGKMIGMVRWRISFILSSQSWEIGSPPTGCAGRMK